MTYSVVIPTYNRPACIERNLSTLAGQVPAPLDVVIVDASTDARTREAVERVRAAASGVFGLIYLESPGGRGNTPHSRNRGVRATSGEIVACLDDDAFPRPGWARAMLEVYQQHPDAAGVAGRTPNGVSGEESRGVDAIGRITPSGRILGNFAADPGRVIEIDHMLGANCSWRRTAFESLGGQREDFPLGPQCLMEETEICLRARLAGMKMLFCPTMIADHIGAPQPDGERFGLRYQYFHTRNNLAMLVRNCGLDAMTLRHVPVMTWQVLSEWARKFASGAARTGVTLAGLCSGTTLGLRYRYRDAKARNPGNAP